VLRWPWERLGNRAIPSSSIGATVPFMDRRRSDAILIRRRGLTLVIPDRGPRYYLRGADGAVGRRDGEVMLWVVWIEGAEVIATEAVGDDVRAVERAADGLAATK